MTNRLMMKIQGIAPPASHSKEWVNYKFRAECWHDVEDLLHLMNAVTRIIIWVRSDPQEEMPDKEVVIKVSTIYTLADIKAIMKKVSDGHVMAETVAAENEYTGVRKYLKTKVP